MQKNEVRNNSTLFKELEAKASSFKVIENLCTRIPKQVEECQTKFSSSYSNFMRAMTGECGPASSQERQQFTKSNFECSMLGSNPKAVKKARTKTYSGLIKAFKINNC